MQNANKAARAAGSEIAKSIQEVHGPIWKMRLELVKLIISLCSAILVATITFSGSLIGTALDNCEKTILVASWSALLVSLLSALACFWAHTQLGSFHARFFNFSSIFVQRISTLDPTSDSFQDNSAAVLKDIADQSLKPIGTADAVARWLARLSYFTFAIGIVLFFIFGSMRL